MTTKKPSGWRLLRTLLTIAASAPTSPPTLAGEWVGTLTSVEVGRCQHDVTVFLLEGGARFAGSLFAEDDDAISGELHGEGTSG